MREERKIIISDFDDTLYHDGIISNEDVESINKFREEGNLFIIATGSSYTSFLTKIKNSGIEYDYLIVNHGSTIYKKDNVIFNELLDVNFLKEIIKKYDLNNKNNYTLIENAPGNFFSTAKEGLVTPDTKDITKIYLEFDNETFLDNLNYLKANYGKRINIYDLLNNDVEIISSKASKLSSIDKILNFEKVDNKNVYAIGDGNSDIEMIKKYNGYAMKSSVSELKKYCIKEVNSVSELIKDLL